MYRLFASFPYREVLASSLLRRRIWMCGNVALCLLRSVHHRARTSTVLWREETVLRPEVVNSAVRGDMFVSALAHSLKAPASFFISACPSTCINATLTGLSPWSLMLGIFMKICWEIPNLVKSGQKGKFPSITTFHCCQRCKFAIKAFLYNTQHLHVVDSNSTVCTECIVASLRQWVGKSVTLLRYTYIILLFF